MVEDWPIPDVKLKIKHGDILSVTEGIIVHGCNAQGKYQSGIAGLIRAKYPQAYEAYYQTYLDQQCSLNLGQIIPCWISPELIIINAITQKYYGRDGKRYVNYDAVEECFEKVAAFVIDHNLRESTINFPQIGAGLGGGDWNKLLPRIEQGLFDHMIYLKRTLWIY